eukprot:3890279-Rhodomonas_salina.1
MSRHADSVLQLRCRELGRPGPLRVQLHEGDPSPPFARCCFSGADISVCHQNCAATKKYTWCVDEKEPGTSPYAFSEAVWCPQLTRRLLPPVLGLGKDLPTSNPPTSVNHVPARRCEVCQVLTAWRRFQRIVQQGRPVRLRLRRDRLVIGLPADGEARKGQGEEARDERTTRVRHGRRLSRGRLNGKVG